MDSAEARVARGFSYIFGQRTERTDTASLVLEAVKLEIKGVAGACLGRRIDDRFVAEARQRLESYWLVAAKESYHHVQNSQMHSTLFLDTSFAS